MLWRDTLQFPVICAQALWVAARATRLPEAAGPRAGKAGQGRALRVLILGDSSAAGVGVSHQDDALAGRLVARLGVQHTVDWQLWAQSGLTTSGALRLLAAKDAADFDIAVLALGVNDVKNGVSAKTWRSNYAKIIHQLSTRFGVSEIYASGVPPLGAFPLLPAPLRTVLGARATRFDNDLSALCQASAHARHVPFDIPLNDRLVAADGFHPSAVLYDIWAKHVSAAIESAQGQTQKQPVPPLL